MLRAARQFRAGGLAVHGRTICGSCPAWRSGSREALRRLMAAAGSEGAPGIRGKESRERAGTAELIKRTASGNGTLVKLRSANARDTLARVDRACLFLQRVLTVALRQSLLRIVLFRMIQLATRRVKRVPKFVMQAVVLCVVL